MKRARVHISQTTGAAIRLCLVACIVGAVQPLHATINPTEAASIFAQAHEICARDNGALWGHTLCGPMLLVDGDDRAVVANQADAGGILKRAGDVFIGTLPKDVVTSDTTVTWSGTRWCELLWPWPMREDDAMRHVTLAHEMFHRIQVEDLGIPKDEGNNAHLDTLEGRYLLQIEWRALAAALQTHDANARRAAITDAVLFRAERYRRFPEAADNERALENNEGIAEYTGVRLGLTTSNDRIKYALRDLSTFADAPSFVRSFAYATGPAYGLLLDDAAPGWQTSFKAAPHALRFDQRLRDALHLAPPDIANLSARKTFYDADGSLYKHELARDEKQRAQVAKYRAALVEGAVLVLNLAHPSWEFKPQSLVPLGELGTVYPTMRLHDSWGTLTVTGGGVLVGKDFDLARVSLSGFDPKTGKGDGYTLELNPGWTTAKGERAGDLTVMKSTDAPGGH